MNIALENRSKQLILYSVNDVIFCEIAPQSRVVVECENTGYLKLFLRHNYESYFINKWKKALYYLVVDSEFIFNNVVDDTNIVITRERIRKDANTSYDRFFVHNSIATLISEHHSANGKDRMCKDYKKFKKSLILTDLFGDFVLILLRVFPLFLLVKIALIVDNIKIPWFYFFLVSLIFLTLMQIGKLLVKPIQKIAKNMAGNQKEGLLYEISKTDFDNFKEYFGNANIIEYYSLPNRKPYSRDIEYQ